MRACSPFRYVILMNSCGAGPSSFACCVLLWVQYHLCTMGLCLLLGKHAPLGPGIPSRCCVADSIGRLTPTPAHQERPQPRAVSACLGRGICIDKRAAGSTRAGRVLFSTSLTLVQSVCVGVSAFMCGWV